MSINETDLPLMYAKQLAADKGSKISMLNFAWTYISEFKSDVNAYLLHWS